MLRLFAKSTHLVSDNGAHWFHYELSSVEESADNDRVLLLRFPNFDWMQFCLLFPDGHVDRCHSGNDMPFAGRALPFGGQLIPTAYALAIFAYLREPSCLWCCADTSVFALLIAGMRGLGQQFLAGTCPGDHPPGTSLYRAYQRGDIGGNDGKDRNKRLAPQTGIIIIKDISCYQVTNMLKTLSFAALHFSVAFTVAWLITGSLLAGGLVALIEPTINSVAYHFHEKAWLRHGRSSTSPSPAGALAA